MRRGFLVVVNFKKPAGKLGTLAGKLGIVINTLADQLGIVVRNTGIGIDNLADKPAKSFKSLIFKLLFFNF